jgi:hypothetical protein
VRKRENRGTTREPRYALCECGAFLGFVPREDENSPRLFEAVVKGPFGRPSGHAVRVLRRSDLRAVVGDQSAADALDRLAAHLAATT